MDEASRANPVGIANDIGHRRRPSLGDRAKRLLVDGRQPAELVPGGGIVVDLGAEHRRVVLPPVDLVDQLLPDLLGDGATGEQVLAAIHLAGLPEDDRAALPDDLVRRAAERRVRGDAGPSVRPAALQRQHELRCRDRLALRLVRFRQQLLDRLDSGLDGLPEPAILLDRQHQRLVAVERGVRDHVFRLVCLAAEAEDDVAADIRMIDDTCHRLLEQVEVVRAVMRATPALGREADDPVDVRELVHDRVVAEVIGDAAGRGRGAVHAGEDGDVVACADPAISPAVPHERPPLGLRHHLDRLVIRREGVVEIELALMHLDILRVHMLPGGDIHRGEADDLPVTADLGALRDVTQGDLVPGRDHLRDLQLAVLHDQRGTGEEGGLGNTDIVAWIKAHGDIVKRGASAVGGAKQGGRTTGRFHNESFRRISGRSGRHR